LPGAVPSSLYRFRNGQAFELRRPRRQRPVRFSPVFRHPSAASFNLLKQPAVVFGFNGRAEAILKPAKAPGQSFHWSASSCEHSRAASSGEIGLSSADRYWRSPRVSRSLHLTTLFKPTKLMTITGGWYPIAVLTSSRFSRLNQIALAHA